MGIMQTRTVQYVSAFVAALLTLSALASMFAHPAMAATSQEVHALTNQDLSSMEMLDCTLDCGEAQDCFEHCVQQLEDDHDAIATLPFRPLPTADDLSFKNFELHSQIERLFFTNHSERAPPELIFLRSVRKLE